MRPGVQSIDYRALFSGLEVEVPLLDGRQARYINFDNAASTPPLASVRSGVDAFLDYYASVHRGNGFKSQLSTWAYESARERALSFVGADPSDHICIFGKNTTEAINKLARRLGLRRDDVVLVSSMEHHSNDLPFRAIAQVKHIGLLPDGRLDLADYQTQLERNAGKVRLVALAGASNVTGYLNPLHQMAEQAHQAGALMLADCAQLAPHRQVEMLALADPAHFDFVALSAHKLYAPFGTGALIGRRDVFERGEPDQQGGGTVEIVTLEDVVWAGPPDRDEAGSPNVVGAVAMALAMRQLESLGMDAIAGHEAELTAYALQRLSEVPSLHIYGDTDPGGGSTRLGVIPFRLDGFSHFLVAAVLGHEFGIGVRSGCFCAHPYVLALLGLNQAEAAHARQLMLEGDRSQMPGMIRASFGLYNTPEEIDALVAALHAIAGRQYRGEYVQDTASGEYHPRGWNPDFRHYFNPG